MAEHDGGGHVLVTHIDGQRVELPGTIGGIRAGLPDDDARAAFDAAIASAPLHNVGAVAARWGLPKEARDQDDAVFARLEAGDFEGLDDFETLRNAG